jgi:hypothetical protein
MSAWPPTVIVWKASPTGLQPELLFGDVQALDLLM